MWEILGNICEGPSWVITWGNVWVICGKYLGSMLEILVGAQSRLWACMSILVSGLMRFRLENLYLNNSQQKIYIYIYIRRFLFCASANMWICCKTYPYMPLKERKLWKKKMIDVHIEKIKIKNKETKILCINFPMKQRNKILVFDSLQRFFVDTLTKKR